MAFEIVNVLKEHFPALRLIGKRYTDADRDAGGGFGEKHREWHEKACCAGLAKLGAPGMENGMFGLMTLNSDDHKNFAYWIGYLFPPGTPVPDGFSSLDLPESDVGVTWIRGDDGTGEIFGADPHAASYKKLAERGWGDIRQDAGGANTLAFFERYNPGRFQRDAQGKIIVDYGFYLA